MKVAVVGCGNISDIYFQNLKTLPSLEVVACADIDLERAQHKAQKHGIPVAGLTRDIVNRPEVELVVNLTRPQQHAELALEFLRAGKHVYNEKPFATRRADGRQVLEEARRRGLRVGCAPDTFLGAGLQTCRKTIDDGVIGQPVAATAFMLSHGPEGWHPEPDFFFQEGGGPLFDMGPYYLTALIALMGPVRRVAASAQAFFPHRIIGSGPRAGERVPVTTPTHVAGQLEFHSGAIATLVFSFDVWASQLPRIEIYGTEGSLSVPDPNFFGGTVRVHRMEDRGWRDVPLTHANEKNSRGLGVLDLARALPSNRPHRASGDMAYHVLDVMESLLEAARNARHSDLQSTCARPAALPPGLPEGHI